jgi:FtsP/CotA-like multicopper oxidase with cupredoxin domain
MLDRIRRRLLSWTSARRNGSASRSEVTAGLLALTLFGFGVSARGGGGADLGPELAEPQVIMSKRGVLELTLEAAPSVVTVAGQTFFSNVYNGQYIPPLFRLRRNDELHLRLVNRIGPADIQIDTTQATNLHYHGMSISPRPPADDIYVTIPSLEMIGNPAASATSHQHMQMAMRDNYVFEYRWRVPSDHDQGPFWYHSHAHGQAEPQVLSGLSGMFMIDGYIESEFPSLTGARERILLLKDIQLPGADDSAPFTKTINGQTNPTITVTRGQPQIWQIGNIGADRFFDLEVEGHEFWVLSRDGNPLAVPYRESHLFIPPGARYTVFLNAQKVGRFTIKSRAVDTGPAGDPNPEVRLGTVAVEAASVFARQGPSEPGLPIRTRRGQPSVADALRAMPIANRRVITFEESADGNTFYINGQQWSPDRNDTVAQVGDVEEWTVRNVTGEHHVFHIHQLDFLVTAGNVPASDMAGLMDTVNVPYATNGVPGEVKILVPFLRDRIEGRFVYHCHILEHEDGGMMANILVQPRSPTSVAQR